VILRQITFDGVPGDVPVITADTTSLELVEGSAGTGVITIAADDSAVTSLGNYTARMGTTENDVCNNRGLCDTSTGKCTCFSGWASSDGLGNAGALGDCGYRVSSKTTLTAS
jgi:hypothetical protein